ncbi:MAG: hypothetical protein KC462_06315, partial [Cyanobacteria bacterium HKST-UBA05]|nr:hypothetical protein [Cyanobacteria bacterium HKST-UBA05]
MLTLHPNQVIAVGLSASICLSQLSWADVNIGNQLVKNQAGTSHTITDGNLIQVDGYLRSVEADANGKYTGNGGSVVLNSGNLLIISGSGVVDASAVYGGKNGGNVTLNAPFVVVNGQIKANSFAGGNAGFIQVNAGQFDMGANARLEAYSAQGMGGRITINATDKATVAGTMRTTGNPGDNPNYGGAANHIEIVGHGVEIASTANIGAFGGNIKVESTNGITQDGVLNTTGGYHFTGGNIILTTTVNENTTNKNINVGGVTYSQGYYNQDGGLVSMKSAGDITVRNTALTSVSGGVTADGEVISNAGNIILDADGSISVVGDGKAVNLTATGGLNKNTKQYGKGGTVSMTARNGDLSVTATKAVAEGGTGGTFEMKAENGTLSIGGNTYFNASGKNYADMASGGTITLAANNVNMNAHSVFPTLMAVGAQEASNKADNGQGHGGT